MIERERNDLSPTGTARRDAMLGELVEVMRQTHRQRRIRRRTAGVICCGLGVGLAGWFAFQSPNAWERGSKVVERGVSEPERVVSSGGPASVPSGVKDEREGETDRRGGVTIVPWESSSRRTEMVVTDPSIRMRFAVHPTLIVEHVDDDTLVTLLVRIHRPAGLIRIGDRVALTVAVTDDELEAKVHKRN